MGLYRFLLCNPRRDAKVRGWRIARLEARRVIVLGGVLAVPRGRRHPVCAIAHNAAVCLARPRVAGAARGEWSSTCIGGVPAGGGGLLIKLPRERPGRDATGATDKPRPRTTVSRIRGPVWLPNMESEHPLIFCKSLQTKDEVVHSEMARRLLAVRRNARGELVCAVAHLPERKR
jgi:hypothetical protein